MKTLRVTLTTLEVLLYALCVADAFILLALTPNHPSYLPFGGLSLIPLLALARGMHVLRERYFD